MNTTQKNNRYKVEKEFIIIEVGVKNSRQIFNERDPSPFRERDLDPQFVIYLVSAVEEFSLQTKIKIRILSADTEDLKLQNQAVICEAIHAYFEYESTLTKSKLRKRHRTSRYFFLIGMLTLIICVSLAQFIEKINLAPSITQVVSVSLIITGWVALWHPLEALLYDWWPIREQRQYFDKIALLDIEVVALK